MLTQEAALFVVSHKGMVHRRNLPGTTRVSTASRQASLQPSGILELVLPKQLETGLPALVRRTVWKSVALTDHRALHTAARAKGLNKAFESPLI